jgi:hypothetical protein
MSEPRPNKKGVHWLVQVWVFFHLFMILSWSLPDAPDRIFDEHEQKSPKPKPIKEKLRDIPNEVLYFNRQYIKESPTRYYLYTTGFWQYWNMFSPNPANVDVYIDALVTYQDGSQKTFEYPAMQKLSVFERYFKERYRKFVENAHPDRYAYKWPAVAQAIAYQSYQGDGNFPVAVTLRRHFKTVMPPGQRTDPTYQEYAFFSYMVDIEKLKKQVHG